MKHTTKLLLTMVVTLVTVIGLCGCPSPVNDYADTHEHIWELVEEVKPTCTTKGTKTYKCKLCEETKVEEVSALGHTWVEDENHSCHYKCHCCATKVQHHFECGGCDKCGAFEFNGENDYQIELKIYKNIVRSNYWDTKNYVCSVFFSFNEDTLLNYNVITIISTYMGETDEQGNEIPTKEVSVSANDLLHLKTNYKNFNVSVGTVGTLSKGFYYYNLLVE